MILIGTIFSHLRSVKHYPLIQDFSKSYEIILNNEKGKQQGNLYEYFQGTKFSLINENIFNNVKYFKGIISGKIKENESEKRIITEFIFPPSIYLKAVF